MCPTEKAKNTDDQDQFKRFEFQRSTGSNLGFYIVPVLLILFVSLAFIKGYSLEDPRLFSFTTYLFAAILASILFTTWHSSHRVYSVEVSESQLILNRIRSRIELSWDDILSISYFSVRTHGSSHFWVRTKKEGKKAGVCYFEILFIPGEWAGTSMLNEILDLAGEHTEVKEILTYHIRRKDR